MTLKDVVILYDLIVLFVCVFTSRPTVQAHAVGIGARVCACVRESRVSIQRGRRRAFEANDIRSNDMDEL
jgi:hypothetical protein